MILALQFAVALAPVFAGWAVVAGIASIRTSRADLALSAWRGLLAATLCAAVATAGLVTGFVTHDFAMRLVAQASSAFMPLRYVPAALLSAPGGALLAFAALAGVFGLSVSAAATDPARRWAVAVAGAALFVPLLIVAALATPFAAHTLAGDGAGLSPDLQRGAAVLRAVASLVAAACVTAAFADTLSAVAARQIENGWSRRVRRWNVLGWTALVVALVAGARWHALNPVRGDWLADPSTALWLLPCAAGAWLVHLDSGVQDAARLATRLFLIAGVFIAVMVALAYSNGTFVNGVVPTDRGHAGAWIGVVPVIALAMFIGRLRRGSGVLTNAGAIVAARTSAAGAWIARAGIILLLAAALGSRATRVQTVTLGDAAIFRTRDPFGHQWQFVSQGVSTLQRENYASLTVSLMTEVEGKRLGMFSAEARSYLLGDGAPAGAPAFITGKISRPFLETRLTVVEPEGKRPTLRITFVPLAPWVVVGAWLVVIGTLVPLFPVPARPDEVAA